MFFDDLFDSVNGSSSKLEGGKIYRTAVTAKSPHHKLWYKSLPILKSMAFIAPNGKEGKVPTILSWIKTVENIQRLVK